MGQHMCTTLRLRETQRAYVWIAMCPSMAQHTSSLGVGHGEGRKGESEDHQVDTGSFQPIRFGAVSPIPASEAPRGNTDLAGHILRLRAEVLRHFPAARGEVQDGGGGHVGSLGIVCVVKACGRGCRAGAVPGGRGLWERFGCKKGTTPGCCELDQDAATQTHRAQLHEGWAWGSLSPLPLTPVWCWGGYFWPSQNL